MIHFKGRDRLIINTAGSKMMKPHSCINGHWESGFNLDPEVAVLGFTHRYSEVGPINYYIRGVYIKGHLYARSSILRGTWYVH
jgi:hypothetical protein